MSREPAEALLDRVIVILDETQDLVNIALVVRAMKNMGLRRLRLVKAREFDAYRIEGIAHDTADVISGIEHFHDLSEALADVAWVVGTTARRRASRQQWWSPQPGAEALAARLEVGPVGLLFGREDRGLSNDQLDQCHALISIPVSPDHPSMNLGQASAIVLYEVRKAIDGAAGLEARDLSHKKQTPTATAGELEEFFQKWEEAMQQIGLFQGIDPVPKMRSFRSIFQRADLNRRELGLVQAAAFEIIGYAEMVRKLAREAAADRTGTDGPGSEDS